MSSVYPRRASPPVDALPLCIPADVENFVSHMKTTKSLPPITWNNLLSELNWWNVVFLGLTPLLGILGAYHTKLRWETALFSVFYYHLTGFGITAGYHRLWAHRSYNAGKLLQYFLAIAGAGGVQGTIKWWSRGHRAHHRYTDTELDPYNAGEGFWYSHIGWLLFRPRPKPGVADVNDLTKNEVVRWQQSNTRPFASTRSRTGSVSRRSTTGTGGEGYHNFHHQFPMDYRNGVKWYQYDPTKWFIWVCQQLGLASHLKVFPDNEVRKSQLTMQLKRLRETQESLAWPSDNNDLPVISWESFIEQSAKHPLILISGFIHDLASFIDDHPGGAHWIIKYIGKDATTAFFGGVYNHSNAAHNLLAMKRVGVLHGGFPQGVDDKVVPPSQRLKIARYAELAR
ncbi:Acyl-CoA desaturase [Mycena venus]|uniref:Acyl-CoA desaturase n=1 Tax=Mycena venus TaxID=2733690 RepID=A0A8H7CGD8_9AGAR|nr:Acyl-CoA desaturase [Mycena venus]